MIDRETIAAAYDAAVDEEYNRLVSSPIREYEFSLIAGLIEEHTPPQGSIVDIGGGPGRYAEHCLGKGYKVGIVDLSERSLSVFAQRLDRSSEKLLFNKVSCATSLEWIPDESADTVLLMGPMYHLTDQSDQYKALSHCRRILKCRGHLITMFLSTFSLRLPNPGIGNPEQNECSGFYGPRIPDEETTTIWFHGHSVPQFRCSPAFAGAMLSRNGFNTMQLSNIEGVGMHFSHCDLERYQDETSKTALRSLLEKTGSIPELSGITEQFLIVAERS